MPTNTTNLNLKTYNNTTDGSALFQTFRSDIAGVGATSNMNLIDTWAGSVSGSLITLSTRKPLIYVAATYDSPNTYLATVADITAYTTNQVISLSLDTTSNGTVGLNINSLGNKYLQKVDQDGNLGNLTNSDMKKNREYIFRYNGTAWVWIAASTGDQITMAGSANDFVMISGCGVLIDSGSSFNSFSNLFAPSAGSYVVMGLNPSLSNEVALTAGSYVTITTNSSASTVTIAGSTVQESRLSFSDNTTQNASQTQHGLSLKVGTPGQKKAVSSGSAQIYIDDETGFSVIIGDGTTAPIPTGRKGDIEVPVNCQLKSWTALLTNISGSTSGSIVIDVYRSDYTNYPVTSASSISGSATKVTVINATKAQDNTLVNWSPNLTKGDILSFNVDACSGSMINQATVSFKAKIMAMS